MSCRPMRGVNKIIDRDLNKIKYTIINDDNLPVCLSIHSLSMSFEERKKNKIG